MARVREFLRRGRLDVAAPQFARIVSNPLETNRAALQCPADEHDIVDITTVYEVGEVVTKTAISPRKGSCHRGACHWVYSTALRCLESAARALLKGSERCNAIRISGYGRLPSPVSSLLIALLSLLLCYWMVLLAGSGYRAIHCFRACAYVPLMACEDEHPEMLCRSFEVSSIGRKNTDRWAVSMAGALQGLSLRAPFHQFVQSLRNSSVLSPQALRNAQYFQYELGHEESVCRVQEFPELCSSIAELRNGWTKSVHEWEIMCQRFSSMRVKMSELFSTILIRLRLMHEFVASSSYGDIAAQLEEIVDAADGFGTETTTLRSATQDTLSAIELAVQTSQRTCTLIESAFGRTTGMMEARGRWSQVHSAIAMLGVGIGSFSPAPSLVAAGIGMAMGVYEHRAQGVSQLEAVAILQHLDTMGSVVLPLAAFAVETQSQLKHISNGLVGAVSALRHARDDTAAMIGPLDNRSIANAQAAIERLEQEWKDVHSILRASYQW